MSIETIGSNINIKTADTGFFKRLNQFVSISAIAIIFLFLLWVMFSKESAINAHTYDRDAAVSSELAKAIMGKNR